MELKKILIITSSVDETVSYIMKKYSEIVDFFRVDVDKFSEYRFCIGNSGWSISDKYSTIDSESIYSIYYRNINLYAWIFQAINVRGFMASTFGDLKKSTEKQKEQTWQIYYDWQQSKRKADMYVSFVLNIKIWIITVIILTIIFSVFLPFSKKSVIVPFDEDNAYTLDANLIESTYDKSAADWYLILAKLQTDKYSQVVVLHNKVSDADVANKLNEFQNQKIIWMPDNTLQKNQIKIILEK